MRQASRCPEGRQGVITGNTQAERENYWNAREEAQQMIRWGMNRSGINATYTTGLTGKWEQEEGAGGWEWWEHPGYCIAGGISRI